MKKKIIVLAISLILILLTIVCVYKTRSKDKADDGIITYEYNTDNVEPGVIVDIPKNE